eukprot:gene4041-736_t
MAHYASPASCLNGIDATNFGSPCNRNTNMSIFHKFPKCPMENGTPERENPNPFKGPTAQGRPTYHRVTPPAPLVACAALGSLHGPVLRAFIPPPRRLFPAVVDIPEDDGGAEMYAACKHLYQPVLLAAASCVMHPSILAWQALQLRHKYRHCRVKSESKTELASHLAQHITYQWGTHQYEYGVLSFTGQKAKPIPYNQYFEDMNNLNEIINTVGSCRSATRARLDILDAKYNLHVALNSELEDDLFYPSERGGIHEGHKVDNNIRLATCMPAADLLRFIKTKAKECPHDLVQTTREGKPVTLSELLQKYHVDDPDKLTVEGLGVQPLAIKSFARFDMFSEENGRGVPGASEILAVFLRRSPPNNGRYFAEIVRPLLLRNDQPGSTLATEMQLPIFGTIPGEWESLAHWVCTHQLNAQNNRWVVQVIRIPALRNIMKCNNLQEQLDNIFKPLLEATLYPENQPELSAFFNNVGCFNIIGDESNILLQTLPEPDHIMNPRDWKWEDNPPDLYFNYLMWANLVAINDLRSQLGLNTFELRPNAGEDGESMWHLISAYLLADSINHGWKMHTNPTITWLYIMAQVGVCMTPLANNFMTVKYMDHPLPKLFRQEYGMASKMYRFTTTDVTEIARNSVLVSGFPDEFKARWLGGNFSKGVDGNNIPLSHVPHCRLQFRHDCLMQENDVLWGNLMKACKAPPQYLAELGNLGGLKLAPLSGSKAVAAPGNTHQHTTKYRRQFISGPPSKADTVQEAKEKIVHTLELRRKYVWSHPIPVWRHYDRQSQPTVPPEALKYRMIGGVAHIDVIESMLPEEAKDFRIDYENCGHDGWGGITSLHEFVHDFKDLHNIVETFTIKKLAHKRCRVLWHKFALHTSLNRNMEEEDDAQEMHTDYQQRGVGGKDFYKSYKVDTHIHMSAGMTAKQLLEFIKEKAIKQGDDIVKIDDQGNPVTLSQLFEDLSIDPRCLTVAKLGVQAGVSEFERFDNFNGKYNPMGHPELRAAFLKTDNYMGGRYFAELIKVVFKEMEQEEKTFAECRLSVYGNSPEEWKKLAAWWSTHGMDSLHNKWMIQIPRLFSVLVRNKRLNIRTFEDLLKNLFEPLFRVTVDPTYDPNLAHFLDKVSGFDCVDDESRPDPPVTTNLPNTWTKPVNPPYYYWMYFIWANITTLNCVRAAMGKSVFSFRPHCGESGALDHLTAGFLLADSLNHGINIDQNPVLQYIYYLAQVGLAVSPLSNNVLFRPFLRNPFPRFFRAGLNVSLSTDDPLQFHYTQEPLIEEYSMASKMWKLSTTDCCEIAKMSILQSGFTHQLKSKWLGNHYYLHSSRGNDASKSNVSDIRCAYRYEVYWDEVKYLQRAVQEKVVPSAMMPPEKEEIVLREEQPVEEEYSSPSPEDFSRSPARSLSVSSTHHAQSPPRRLVPENERLKGMLLQYQTLMQTHIPNADISASWTDQSDGI